MTGQKKVSFKDLAVIIPVAPGDNAWMNLIPDLCKFLSESEIILVGSRQMPKELSEFLPRPKSQKNPRWVLAKKQNRGVQLNAGASATDKKHLWFLHCDSRIASGTMKGLRNALKEPDMVSFFKLKFLDDGPALTFLNTLGAGLRSQFLKLPFGDQGFCLTHDLFKKIGGFPENVKYGEDHLFIWRARHMGVPLKCTDEVLYTSARKYRTYGWAQTTLSHFRLTLRQAAPEYLRLLRARLS